MYKKLIKWSQSFSDLPWRIDRTLYTTLVSEVMLQQTTVGTVFNHFDKFISEYPTIFDVAKASEEQLTISWKGLGFYRRARNLKKACEFIVNEFQGEIPLVYETLIDIPGIGPYTASALIAIGANRPAIAVDANLERVLSRIYGIKEFKGPKLLKLIQADKKILLLVKKYGPRDFNEALMDLGRNYCQSRRASCDLCPLSSKCIASSEDNPLNYPLVKESKSRMYELELVRFIVKKNNKLLVYKKSEKEWLQGQWEVPTFIYKSEDNSLKQYPKSTRKLVLGESVKTSITKYKIKNHLIEVTEAQFKKMYPAKKYQFRTIKDESNLASNIAKFLK